MIGILDWGVGGLWAARALHGSRVGGLVYLSDAGNIPYGLQDRQSLVRSVSRAIGRLQAVGASRVLVACHSASTVLSRVERPAGVWVDGVINPRSVPDVRGTTLVVGGARTIRSGAWRRALAGRRVVQRIAQPWSAAVERGDARTPTARAMVREVLAPVGDVAQVVLACTHYIALDQWIAEALPGVPRIDPALAVAARIAESWGTTAPGGDHDAGGAIRAFTTGNPDAVQAVATAMVPDLRVRFHAWVGPD